MVPMRAGEGEAGIAASRLEASNEAIPGWTVLTAARV